MAQCEVLAHRLGLVPLQLDPELFQDKAGAPRIDLRHRAMHMALADLV